MVLGAFEDTRERLSLPMRYLPISLRLVSRVCQEKARCSEVYAPRTNFDRRKNVRPLSVGSYHEGSVANPLGEGYID